MLRDVGDEAAREVARAAHAHLRLRRRGEQRGDGVAEAGLPQVHFAQAVEEEQALLVPAGVGVLHVIDLPAGDQLLV